VHGDNPHPEKIAMKKTDLPEPHVRDEDERQLMKKMGTHSFLDPT
jgi:hypothetical protein